MTKIQNEKRNLKFMSWPESYSKFKVFEFYNFDIVLDF